MEPKKWVVTPRLVGLIREFEKLVSVDKRGHIIIEGPPRVGKSLFTHIFTSLKRAEREKARLPWQEPLRLNCAELRDSNLIVSELFGHKKGSFTGAIKDRKGLLEENAAGLVILEEIGELNDSDQAKLLVFLDRGEYKPLGGNTIKRSDVQIIATTNQTDIRTDFRYRFSHFKVPGLHERRQDILYYIFAFMPELIPRLRTWEAFDLLNYHWPGGVSEIQEVCKTIEIGLLKEVEAETKGLRSRDGVQGALFFNHLRVHPGLNWLSLCSMLDGMSEVARRSLIDELKTSRIELDFGSERPAFPEFVAPMVRTLRQDEQLAPQYSDVKPLGRIGPFDDVFRVLLSVAYYSPDFDLELDCCKPLLESIEIKQTESLPDSIGHVPKRGLLGGVSMRDDISTERTDLGLHGLKHHKDAREPAETGNEPLRPWREVESEYFARVFKLAKGNVSEVGRLTGLTRKVAQNILRKHGLPKQANDFDQMGKRKKPS